MHKNEFFHASNKKLTNQTKLKHLFGNQRHLLILQKNLLPIKTWVQKIGVKNMEKTLKKRGLVKNYEKIMRKKS